MENDVSAVARGRPVSRGGWRACPWLMKLRRLCCRGRAGASRPIRVNRLTLTRLALARFESELMSKRTPTGFEGARAKGRAADRLLRQIRGYLWNGNFRDGHRVIQRGWSWTWNASRPTTRASRHSGGRPLCWLDYGRIRHENALGPLAAACLATVLLLRLAALAVLQAPAPVAQHQVLTPIRVYLPR